VNDGWICVYAVHHIYVFFRKDWTVNEDEKEDEREREEEDEK